MVLSLTGTIRGRHIELDGDTNLPEGAPVKVRIEAEVSSLDERRRKIGDLCGAWGTDDSLGAIFDEIEQERRSRGSREIDLDGAS